MIDLQILSDDVWVFLSHSHNDYDKVIQIRNLLEKRKFKPLMFFLKCLEDDTEIDSLIKREIDCRYRFILCDSTNAKASKWVQEEVRYIKEEKNRFYETINLDEMSIEKIDEKLREFEQRSLVTILSQQTNMDKALKIAKDISNYSFRIKYGDISNIIAKKDVLTKTIKKCADTGIVLLMCNNSETFINYIYATLVDLSKYEEKDFIKRIILFYDNNRRIRAFLGEENIMLHKTWFHEIVNWDVYDFLSIAKSKDEIRILTDKAWGEERARLFELMIDNGTLPPTAYARLSSIYENGEWGVDVDYEKALGYLAFLRMEGISISNIEMRIREKMRQIVKV